MNENGWPVMVRLNEAMTIASPARNRRRYLYNRSYPIKALSVLTLRTGLALLRVTPAVFGFVFPRLVHLHSHKASGPRFSLASLSEHGYVRRRFNDLPFPEGLHQHFLDTLGRIRVRMFSWFCIIGDYQNVVPAQRDRNPAHTMPEEAVPRFGARQRLEFAIRDVAAEVGLNDAQSCA